MTETLTEKTIRTLSLAAEGRTAAENVEINVGDLCVVIGLLRSSQSAADALESSSRALSEKEGELERSELGRHRLGHALREASRQRDEALAALKASEERGLVLREALLGMEHSCEQLAAIRSLEAYDAICRDSGGVQALLNLDTARRRARSVLENGPAALADATQTAGLVERLRDERHCNDWYLRQEAAAVLAEMGQVAAKLAAIPLGNEIAEDAGLVIYKNAGASITVGDVLAARSVLSSTVGNAGSNLADATKKDPGTEQREAGL